MYQAFFFHSIKALDDDNPLMGFKYAVIRYTIFFDTNSLKDLSQLLCVTVDFGWDDSFVYEKMLYLIRQFNVFFLPLLVLLLQCF